MICLKEDEIHIWSANVNLQPDQLDDVSLCLSKDEIEKANRFKLASHRRSYIARRGILRKLLGKYLDIPVSEISFSYGEHGKPYLEEEGKHISFNLSHSDDMVMYGFSIQKEVGIDIEFMSKEPGVLDALRYSLSKPELEVLETVSSNEKINYLYDHWVYKEALLKSVGIGLNIQPQDVVISSRSSSGSIAVKCLGDQQLSEAEWSMQRLDLIKGFACAVCVAGSALKHSYFKWPSDC